MDDGLTDQRRPLLMGVLNTTPDSFSDGGAFADVNDAVEHGLRLWSEGADWVDIGGESTRPGSRSVSADEEMRRVLPVIDGLLKHEPAIRISIDTSKTTVAKAAIQAGAKMVNDVRAASDPGMAELCCEAGVDVVLMHMRGTPLSMQRDTKYNNLLEEVVEFLGQRLEFVMACGMNPQRVILDPGIGFGKAPLDNLDLIKSVPNLQRMGCRVLIGASRKRFIGHITGEDEPAGRVFGSIGAALAAAAHGADILRVHDVKATKDALKVFAGAYPA